MLTVKVELPDEGQELVVIVVRREESLEHHNLCNLGMISRTSHERFQRRYQQLSSQPHPTVNVLLRKKGVVRYHVQHKKNVKCRGGV